MEKRDGTMPVAFDECQQCKIFLVLMSLEAPFADFPALAKYSQDSAIGKLSHDSALPPV